MSTTNWNWLEFLERAVKEEPSAKQIRRAQILSLEWPTCACGHLCKNLPRQFLSREPTDVVLANLGISFTGHIYARHWPEALATFHKIEARTTELLAQQKGKE